MWITRGCFKYWGDFKQSDQKTYAPTAINSGCCNLIFFVEESDVWRLWDETPEWLDRYARPDKSPFDPSWTCFLQQGRMSAENSFGFCSFWFLRVPTWTREWNRFPDTGQLGWFQMLSSALSWSDLPDSRAAGACRLGHHVAVGNKRDGSHQLETAPLPSFSSICTFSDQGRSHPLCLQHHVNGYISVEMVTFPHKKHGAEGENAGQKDASLLSV